MHKGRNISLDDSGGLRPVAWPVCVCVCMCVCAGLYLCKYSSYQPNILASLPIYVHADARQVAC